MASDSNNAAKKATAALLAILFSGNVFFVKRLVDKIDSLETTVWTLRQDVVILSIKLDGISGRKKANDSSIPERDRKPSFRVVRLD